MTYLQQLQEHYKAVRARINAAAIKEPKLLPKPMPVLLERLESPKPEPEPSSAGLVSKAANDEMVEDALRKANPNLHGGSRKQAIKIAEDIMNCPKLPPLPGLNLDENGVTRWTRVLHAVARHHQLTPQEILSTSRKKHINKARMEVFYRLRVDLKYSYTKIAIYMKRDHTTVLHAVHKIRKELLDELRMPSDDDVSFDGTHLTASEHTRASLSDNLPYF